MKHNDLLFEIGCEELPALVIRPALDFMKQYVEKHLQEAGLTCGTIVTEGTPRRLVLMIRDLSTRQEDRKYEVTGPSTAVAFLENGELSKAGLGFVQAKNLKLEDVFRKTTNKGEVIAGEVTENGKSSEDIVPKILQALVPAIPFPKKMFWDDSGVQFSRPVRWLCALLGDSVLELHFGQVKSSNLSCGHRFLSPSFKVQSSIDSYLTFLRENFVELSIEKRRKLILEQSQQLAQEIKGELLVDEALLNTVVNLVEYPWPLLGSFEEKFLQVPQQVLVSEMREHQKVFSVVSSNGELLPAFIVVAGSRPADAAAVAAGHGRVLRARFEDGAFYFAKDCAHSLENNVAKLDSVMFQYKLGTLKDKGTRLQNLAQHLGAQVGAGVAVGDQLARAALLAKADLVSGVVGEFPELQGVMGRIYAIKDGEEPTVALAIEEHYWPKSAGGELPTSEVGALLALADKLDTIVGIIAIGKSPTASADPFGLRRAAIGCIRIIIDRSYDLSLKEIVSYSANLVAHASNRSVDAIVDEVMAYIKQRARGLLIESSKDSDVSVVADAVLGEQCDNLLDGWARFGALINMKNENSALFDELAGTFKRVGNILKKARNSGEVIGQLKRDHLTEVAELALVEKISTLPVSSRPVGQQLALAIKHYSLILQEIAGLKKHVDRFFDEVMVMCEDHKIRSARMALLAQVEVTVLNIADFSRL